MAAGRVDDCWRRRRVDDEGTATDARKHGEGQGTHPATISLSLPRGLLARKLSIMGWVSGASSPARAQ